MLHTNLYSSWLSCTRFPHRVFTATHVIVTAYTRCEMDILVVMQNRRPSIRGVAKLLTARTTQKCSWLTIRGARRPCTAHFDALLGSNGLQLPGADAGNSPRLSMLSTAYTFMRRRMQCKARSTVVGLISSSHHAAEGVQTRVRNPKNETHRRAPQAGVNVRL